jgi:hypothetical protein
VADVDPHRRESNFSRSRNANFVVQLDYIWVLVGLHKGRAKNIAK